MKKSKKTSGWITPRLSDKSMSYSEMKDCCLEPLPEYNDWADSRDGYRDDWLLVYNLRDKLKKAFVHKQERSKRIQAMKDKRHFWRNVDDIK